MIKNRVLQSPSLIQKWRVMQPLVNNYPFTYNLRSWWWFWALPHGKQFWKPIALPSEYRFGLDFFFFFSCHIQPRNTFVIIKKTPKAFSAIISHPWFLEQAIKETFLFWFYKKAVILAYWAIVLSLFSILYIVGFWCSSTKHM